MNPTSTTNLIHSSTSTSARSQTPKTKTYDVAIVGAGIAGVSAAYFAAKAGLSVALYDAQSHAAMQCSYANGGQLSVSNSQTWHSYSNLLKAARWLGKKDAPLLLRPSLDLDKARWIFGFLKHTVLGHSDTLSTQTIALGLQARLLYAQIAQTEGIDFDYSTCGILHFYKNPQYFAAAKSAQRLYENAGCEWRILTPQEVLHAEPTLGQAKGILGGTFTADDGVGDIHRFCHNLLTKLTSTGKVHFFPNTSLSSDDVLALHQHAHHVIIAAGTHSGAFAKALGDPCTIYPIKGYSITLNQPGDNLPVTSLLDDQAKIVTSTLGARLRVAGTAELAGFNTDILTDRVEPLLRWVRTNFPHLDTRQYQSWACLRPMSVSMMPMVGASRTPGFYYHTGHGHLGWTLAPATAFNLIEGIRKGFVPTADKV